MKRLVWLLSYFSLVFSNLSLAELKPGPALDFVQFDKFGQKVKPLKIIDNLMDNGFRQKGKFVNFRKGDRFSEQFKIDIEYGRLKYRGGLLNTTKGVEFMYIVENDGTIYGASLPMGNMPDGYDGIGMFHSSLVKDEWPIFAGDMRVENGLVTKLINSSGHFQPTGERTAILETYFKKEGVLAENFMPKYSPPAPIQLPRSNAISFREATSSFICPP